MDVNTAMDADTPLSEEVARVLTIEVLRLSARVAELEAERSGIEWGVRYPTGTEELVRDEREAWERVSVRPGRTVVNRTAPGPWRDVS